MKNGEKAEIGEEYTVDPLVVVNGSIHLIDDELAPIVNFSHEGFVQTVEWPDSLTTDF